MTAIAEIRKSVKNMEKKLNLVVKNRPQSAGGNKPRSIISQSTRMSSTMSKVPELAPFQLMNFCNQIYTYKSKIMKHEKVRMREKLTSSQIQRVL
jgi:hypothetical protein